jgi:predicted small lipoprotein YifL
MRKLVSGFLLVSLTLFLTLTDCGTEEPEVAAPNEATD